MLYIFLKLCITKLLEIFDFSKKFVQWRLKNKHNTSVIYNRFSFDNIDVGKNSYGRIGVQRYNTTGEGLKIGNYVSIADNVLFILGGNHQINTLTSFPFKSFYGLKSHCDSQTKGVINVKDEVWIGNNVLILSGVTIGKGAIIAAGSVISKDVAPYTIVGGNPAKTIRNRFSESVTTKLLNFDLSVYPDEKVKAKINLLYEEITEENIDYILSQFEEK